MEFDQLLALGCGVVTDLGRTNSGIALTFDDGPSTYATPKILDTLDKHGVHATFFMIGENARRHPQIAREVAVRGHEVGCHSQNHPDFQWLSPWRIAHELRTCKETLESITGRPVVSLRAPYGHVRWDVRPIAEHLGFLRLVGWNAGPPCDETSPERLVDYVLAEVKPGAIILLHDAFSLEQTDVNHAIGAIVASLDPLLTALKAVGMNICLLS